MFLPVTKAEAKQQGFEEFDVIFVSGDAYIDHPAFGVPLLARYLESHGFRVGIIAQPDWRSCEAFTLLGRPRLFFAVSAGAMDSMVAHYTPARKLRHDDAYTPGNRHGSRPNRATIIYTSRLKETFKDVPVVIGGIEASLRRFAHYDFWDDRVRRSILLDSKADLLVFGMGEHPLLELCNRLKGGEPFADIEDVRGTAIVRSGSFDPGDHVALPAMEHVAEDKSVYAEAFRLAAGEMNPQCGKIIIQPHANRLLICNPPSFPLSEQELNGLYNLPFTKSPHPSYKEPIPAWEQIKTSITCHRGCFGGCAFCAITHHQGKTIQSRSVDSIVAEVERLTKFPWFRGTVSDLGGPTANMYGLCCGNSSQEQSCRRESCLYPSPCRHLKMADSRLLALLKAVRAIDRVKTVSVSSGIRSDAQTWEKEL
jgi:uncharacterized radical SAM protein YgiQ